MTSIRTNSAAFTALQGLEKTQQQLTNTEQNISTGKRINTAADNAAYIEACPGALALIGLGQSRSGDHRGGQRCRSSSEMR